MMQFCRQRIISLVPSQTELLHHLGLDVEVVGITRFCIHPHQWFRTKARVGGTKNVSLDKVDALAPTLILANREENVKDQIEALAAHNEVYVSDVHDLTSALAMIRDIGSLTGRTDAASALVEQIALRFGQMGTGPQRTAAYAIWNDPLMLAGQGTFINDMMQRAGLLNVTDESRYPATTLGEMRAMAPQLLLLSSEPFPFSDRHVTQFKRALPDTEVILVDGEMFSWYGSRMLLAPDYFNKLLGKV
jgi:ABC-type Fe3+-hydroxamate transport system substrate-binding protein